METSINDESDDSEISVDFDYTTSVELLIINLTDSEGTKELLVKQLGL